MQWKRIRGIPLVLQSHNNTDTRIKMHILNQVQGNLICNTDRNLFLWIEIFISTTDLYNTTADRWSCHVPNRNKKYKSVDQGDFEGGVRELRGNVHTSSIGHWKARVRLPIRHSWTFFASSYRWRATTQNVSRLVAFRRGGSVWANISGGRGRPLGIFFWFLQN